MNPVNELSHQHLVNVSFGRWFVIGFFLTIASIIWFDSPHGAWIAPIIFILWGRKILKLKKSFKD